ncbi:glycosyltransferase family 4 protein [Cohnella soli]|uniref:Glycosyltransferase family 4 protein n=1 Tax=Cohnella soli TaxID=425005 RepID=A0ABW0HXC6_9BACL
MIDVLFVTNIPSPYRVEFFNELGKHCNLTVWFEAKSESNRQWDVGEDGMNFKYEFLKGFTLGLDKHVNWNIIRKLKEKRFDLYVMGCYSSPTEMAAIAWLNANKIPFVLNSDGGFIAEGESGWKRKLKTRFIATASGWLSSGKTCTDYLLHYGARKENVYEYPFASCTYNEDELAPMSDADKDAFKRAEGLQGKVILSVGQFIPRKGLDGMIGSLADLRLEDTTVVAIGGGPLKERYTEIAREKKMEHLVLKDFMNRESLLSYYKAADLFVLPTRYDVWGLVINEAMTFGLPVVTTKGAGASHTLVEEGVNGYAVEVDDYGALGRRCAALLANDDLRSRFGAASRRKAEAYTIARMAERHVEIFRNETLRRKRAPSAGSPGEAARAL